MPKPNPRSKSMPKPNPKPRLKSMPKPNPGSKKACQNLTETTKFRCYALNSEHEDLKRSAFVPKPIVYAGTLDPFSKMQGSGSSCTVNVPDGVHNFLKPRVPLGFVDPPIVKELIGRSLA